MLSVVALSMAYGNRVELRLASFGRDEARALAIAEAGIERALAEMRMDRNGFDCLAEAWRRQYLDTDAEGDHALGLPPPPAEIEFADRDGKVLGKYTLRIQDVSSKFNINSEVSEGTMREILLRLLDELEAEDSDEIADCILDWMDTDDLHRLNGVESEYYESLSPPYSAKNGPFDTIEEMLLVKGVTHELLYGYESEDEEERRQGLADYLTVYNDGGVNVNVAPPILMAAILDVEEPDIESVIDVRDGGDGIMGTEDDRPFESQRDLVNVPEFEALYSTAAGRARFSLLTTRSSYMRLHCEAILGDGAVRRGIVAVVDRGHVPARTVFWRED